MDNSVKDPWWIVAVTYAAKAIGRAAPFVAMAAAAWFARRL